MFVAQRSPDFNHGVVTRTVLSTAAVPVEHNALRGGGEVGHVEDVTVTGTVPRDKRVLSIQLMRRRGVRAKVRSSSAS